MAAPTPEQIEAWQNGHLTFVPGTPERPPLPPGVHGFEGRPGQQHEILVPQGLDPDAAHPLLVFLHGATSNPVQALSMVAEGALARGIIVVAIKSDAASWDILEQGYGPDVVTLDMALTLVGGRMRIDPARMAIGGFSDGASYALSLGLNNGDLFPFVLALSPGFAAPGLWRGKPDIFLSHGTRDRILPIDQCSRYLAAMLMGAGYGVDYREFEGGHSAPPEIMAAALDVAASGRLERVIRRPDD